jgi:hypothetical protein
MSDRDFSFREGFEKFLATIPPEFTVHQWQHAFREAILLMELKIIQRYAEEATALGCVPTQMMMSGNIGVSPYPYPYMPAGGGGHGSGIINVVVAPIISTGPPKDPKS